MARQHILVIEDEADLLELGVDDYITKPFSSRMLRARTKAVLPRKGAVATCQYISAGTRLA